MVPAARRRGNAPRLQEGKAHAYAGRVMAQAQPTFRFADRNGATVLEVAGAWTVFSLRELDRPSPRDHRLKVARKASVVDASGLGQLDTAGVLKILQLAGSGPAEVRTDDKLHADLFRVVQANLRQAPPERRESWLRGWLEEVGHSVFHVYRQVVSLCAFFGEVIVVFAEACLAPRRFRPNAVVSQMYEVWVKALGIVGILCFLIGVVIAYQGVQQLKQFGAETFTVEAVGIGMFRELGVLLTAIIVAGRSGSAFTAQLGTMQVNQEIDAMSTIGLNPIEWLVLPRILALVLSMPLLAFWGDMTGLLGGAFACTIYLDFTFAQFFDRLRDTVGPWHFYTGMIKSPVFGIVIAAIGCFEGLQVKGSAESVGLLTTRSVVESIFCVIVLDAIFSIIFLLANV
jgi:phospholipid/cholesterol/gamma-HCH transport system permease protein